MVLDRAGWHTADGIERAGERHAGPPAAQEPGTESGGEPVALPAQPLLVQPPVQDLGRPQTGRRRRLATRLPGARDDQIRLCRYRPARIKYDPDNPYFVQVDFRFPNGTLQSDELPLSLPLSIATFRRFHVLIGSMEVWRGDVSSYSVVEMPESSSALLLMLVLSLMQRCRMRWRSHRKEQHG